MCWLDKMREIEEKNVAGRGTERVAYSWRRKGVCVLKLHSPNSPFCIFGSFVQTERCAGRC